MSTRRKSLRFQRQTPSGAPPGTLVSRPDAQPTTINLIAFSETELLERSGAAVADIADVRAKFPVVWVDITGLGSSDIVQEIGDLFGLHRLALEDVMNVHQRPKAEEFADHLFLIARMVDEGQHINTEQMAFFLGKNFLVTFQEFPGDCLDPLRERIRERVKAASESVWGGSSVLHNHRQHFGRLFPCS